MLDLLEDVFGGRSRDGLGIRGGHDTAMNPGDCYSPQPRQSGTGREI